ncbi:MAG TPA: hypothetical protein DEA90_12290 [Opitutae bacterium]|nr:hypothetical protein [Puniceicoccaceae bacterium]HBR94931.1 hypothetical protein [Opitutae bacterium]|tara:strand:+ start:28833 stop:29480 length:648 start_codon:yes stop_codon:yes gene_type:complete
MREEVDNTGSLAKAKRQFLVNLCLFGVLLAIAMLLLADPEQDARKTTQPEIPAEVPLSRNEQAYLAGQMLGLSEHPGTVLEYDPEWVWKVSEQSVKQDPAFKNADSAEIELLTAEFFKGYTEKFDEYYDSSAAREFGCQYGVKFNPEIHGLFPRATPGILSLNRAKLETKFHITDEATWRLFCKAFDAGFLQGYQEVVEGKTVQHSHESIILFNE